MKNLLKSLLIMILAISMPINSVFAFYSDVPKNHEYYDEINALYKANLLPTPEDDKFNPDKIVNLGDLFEILLTFGQTETASENPNINLDKAKVDTKFIPYIKKAIELGLLQNSGIDASLSIPKHKILNVLFESMGIGINYFFDKNSFPFTDLKSNAQLAPLAYRAAEIGILEEKTPTSFKASKRITRGQLAEYLYKIATYNTPKQITVIVNPTDTDSFSKEEKALLENAHFPSLVDVFNSLKNEYLYEEEIDDNDLVLGAIEGMASRVKDEYTVFQRAEEGAALIDSLSSEYEGIGIQFELIDGNFTVITPFRGSPAEEAGVLPNDIIKEVDDISILNMTQGEVVSKIKGSAGTKVKLTIDRGGKTLYFTIERKKITYKTSNLTFEKSGDKNIAVVEILSFNVDTYQEFEAAANQIIEQKADGIIIDLRNNPGGFVDVAVAMISLFTDREKTAVKMVDKNKRTEEYKTNKNGILKDYKGKIMILVNGGTASAAEIMAGALKDYGMATIIGEKTFGKGTVQTLKQYEDGSLFKYTIAKWFTPSGLDISEKSLMPSIIVKDSKMQMQKALEQFTK